MRSAGETQAVSYTPYVINTSVTNNISGESRVDEALSTYQMGLQVLRNPPTDNRTRMLTYLQVLRRIDFDLENLATYARGVFEGNRGYLGNYIAVLRARDDTNSSLRHVTTTRDIIELIHEINGQSYEELSPHIDYMGTQLVLAVSAARQALIAFGRGGDVEPEYTVTTVSTLYENNFTPASDLQRLIRGERV